MNRFQVRLELIALDSFGRRRNYKALIALVWSEGYVTGIKEGERDDSSIKRHWTITKLSHHSQHQTRTSSLSIQESQFFSKVIINNNNPKPTEVPNKEEPLSKPEQEEASFTPQTQNGYGLYGHEPGQLPPTTTTNGAPYNTNNLPYKSESENPSNKFYTTNSNNNNYDYKKDGYVTEPHGMSDDTRFMEAGYTTTTNSNNNYYNGDDNYNTQQLQGLSDTRFLENGRYFYDLNRENNYRNGYQNSKGVYYNNKGYYGNNENSNEYYKNSMEGYQNQESEDDFMP
ncbi:hypothetical protein F0562_018398 [Nyssa sinensis]|uniref:Uncharacterized protein n=1 Tax=Nyssa sinensis TaxID=561372 RepID=A0A5J4ZBH8_9ASTE|nr:hypothetical protein F0562_018398 [Nyssa sinensis]